jgi:hypothetical protein
LKRHIAKCFHAKIDDEMNLLEMEHRREIKDILAQKDWEMRELSVQKDMEMKDLLAQKDMEIRELSVRLEMMQKAEEQLKRRADEMIDCQLKRADDMVDCQLKHANDIVEKCIDRPTVTNNNHHHTDDDGNQNDDIPLTVTERIDSIPDSSPSDYMMTLSHLTLNNVTIISRHPDHYVNATQLCQAGAKKFNDWYRLDSTKELIAVLSSDAGIPASLLVESKRGATSLFQQGSWVHPDLAIQLAQWISPSFALQVSRWVRTLFGDGKIAIDLTLMKEQQRRIETLETVCLSKRKREKYEGQFFVYLLTTDDHLKRRIYIVGKAKNLEHRLGTYNKTCDHTVVHYQECLSEENMTLIENMVLHRLNDYREQSNRDRFVLPEDREVTYFQQVIDQCVQFVLQK